MKNTFKTLTLALLIVIGFANCQSPASDPVATAGIDPSELKGQSAVVDDVSAKNILNVAIGSPDHTTLVAGVKAAGLEDVLTNAGPLTVFAPTNAAFDKLPAGTLDNLLKPENKAILANIITFHAAPGNYGPDNIKGVMGIGQATGDKVTVTVKDGETFVNGAKVLGSVKASNGWVHVIDGVLLPPEK